MKKFEDYIKALLEEGNKASSVRAVLLLIGSVVALNLLAICFVLVYDVLFDGEVTTDLSGMSLLVTSFSGVIGAIGLTKVFNKRNKE